MPGFPFYSGVDLKGQKAVNLADPSAPTDAATKQYVDLFVQGRRWKDSVRVAASSNITLTAPGASIDGVAMSAGDRFLALAQTTGSQNGIYVWNGAAVAATRATDADVAAELYGATVGVLEGSTNADKVFVQTVENVTLGTTALSFTQVGGGGGTTYTAGTGVAINAGVISIDTSVVSRKMAAAIGNGTLTSIPVTHNFGTKDIVWSIQEVATGIFGGIEAVATDNNTLTVGPFPTAPTAGQYRVVIVG